MHPHVVTVSGATPAALKAQAGKLASFLADRTTYDLADVAHTLSVRRTHFRHRRAFVATDLGATVEQLLHLGRVPEADAGSTATDGARRVAFLFDGRTEGLSPFVEALYGHEPGFRAAVDRCTGLLPGVRAEDLGGASDEFDEVRSFVFAYALAELWCDWGVRPDVVLGCGTGEVVAAVVAGSLSLTDGLRVARYRNDVVRRVCDGAIIHGPTEVVDSIATSSDDDLHLVARHGPETVLVAATPERREALERSLMDSGVRVVPGSFRLPAEPSALSADRARRKLAGLVAVAPERVLISTVTGYEVGGSSTDAEHWARQLEEPVRLDLALAALRAEDPTTYLQVGVGSGLLAVAARQMGGELPRMLASVRAHRDPQASLRCALSELYRDGADIAWERVLQDRGRMVRLPTYAFQRKRHWTQGAVATENVPTSRVTSAASPGTPLQTSAAEEPHETDLLHEIEWIEGELAPAQRPRPSTWLVACLEDDPLGAAICEGLRRQGCSARRVTPETPTFDDEPSAGSGPTGIIYLTARRRAPSPDPLGDVRSWCQPALELVQALVRQQRGATVWLVSRGAQAVGDAPVELGAGALWGFGRSIAREHPEIWGGLLDLASTAAEGDAEWIVRSVLQPWTDDQIALRNGRTYVPRLRAVGASYGTSEWTPRSTHSYLITGGLGSLGRRAARFLAERGARTLVLTSRRSPEEVVLAELNELRERGVEVQVIPGDVASLDDARALLERIERELPPLGGIVHAAGTLDDGVLENQNWDRFERVLRPKLMGAWHLHSLTRDLNLDCFALFSSISGVLGSPGQSNYACANAFLDSLAQVRHRDGLAASSISFSAWEGGGMADDAETQRRLRAAGLRPLGTREALAAFARALGAKRPTPVVVGFSKETLNPSGTPLLSDLNQGSESGVSSGSAVLAELRGLDPTRLRIRIERIVRDHVARALGAEDSAAIDPMRGFSTLGMNSLGALELRNGLQNALGAQLPPTLAFEFPTIAKLTEHLVVDWVGSHRASDENVDASPRTGLDEARLGESIAIIGASCRFPGGANDPDAYFRLLAEGTDAVREVPRDRWDVGEVFDPNPETPNKTYSRWGAFLDDVRGFDAGFFQISPREATNMDPQQRMFLEVGWEALEQAGQILPRLQEQKTGVFVGVGENEYADVLRRSSEPGSETYLATGNSTSIIAGRFAFALGLTGPTLAVSTACSSALVAVHLAVQSLRRGECKVAVAGGVRVLLSPDAEILSSKLKALSPDGRCKAFDNRANGYVRGEGCGAVVLKRVSDAQRDGDPILAVVRGTAINHDGASSGLTVPSAHAQQGVLTDALADAGVLADEVDYVEAHGSGTPLGDPIEVRALQAVFGASRPADRPLLVGSVKTNIGHLEPAAGMAGLLKIVVALQHGQLPGQLHFESPNLHIPWNDTAIRVLSEPHPWGPQPERRRVAGVSAFGLSGSNAHVVLEEPPAEDTSEPIAGRRHHLLPLSAKSERSLRELARRFANHLESHPELSLADLCRTAAARRNHFQYRLALVASSTTELAADLRAFSAGAPNTARAQSGHCTSLGRLAFLYTGQGDQHTGMGLDLFETSTVFREAVLRCDEVIQRITGESILPTMFEMESASRLQRTRFAQPALFTLEYALTALWSSLGVHPEAVMGHSFGEYVAACTASVMSVDDALRLLIERGRIVEEQVGPGSMATVPLPADRLRPALERCADVALAAHNGPDHVVISGTQDGVERVCEWLRAEESVRAWPLRISHAFHSPMMDAVSNEYEQVVQTASFSQPSLPLVSNLTGGFVYGEICKPSYWCRHTREPVRFFDGVEALRKWGASIFVEIGPQPTLLGMASAFLDEESNSAFIPSLRKDADGWAQMLKSIAELYVRGATIDWDALTRDTGGRHCQLPAYPFDRREFWVGSGTRTTGSPKYPAIHPLLHEEIPVAKGLTALYASELTESSPSYLEDHRLFGRAVLPASAFLEMIRAALSRVHSSAPALVEQLEFLEPLALEESSPTNVQLVVGAAQDGRLPVSIHARSTESSWREHVRGVVRIADVPASDRTPAPVLDDTQRTRFGEEVDLTRFFSFEPFAQMAGPAFHSLRQAFRGGRDVLARVELPDAVSSDAGRYGVHPVLLEGGFHAAALALALDSGREAAMIPIGIQSWSWRRPAGHTLWVHASPRHDVENAGSAIVELAFYDDAGLLIGEARGLQFQSAPDSAAPSRPLGLPESLYQRTWRRLPLPQGGEREPASAKHWLLLVDDQGIGEALAEHLRTQGQRVTTLAAAEAFRRTRADHWELNPAAREDFERLARELGTRGESPSHVVDLWPLSRAADPENPLDGAAHALVEGAALHLVQMLVQAVSPEPPRLWWVTRGASELHANHEADQEDARRGMVQATLYGLSRVVAAEHPELYCSHLDLDPTDSLTTHVQVIGAEIGAPPTETQISYVLGERHVARFTHAPHLAEGTAPLPALDPSSTYLITGGLGGLGLQVATQLKARGARYLALLARSAPSETQQRAISELQSDGVTVCALTCDVSKRDELAVTLSDALSSLPPLKGIVHAAGAVSDASLLQQEWPAFHEAMGAKIAGSWHLHEVTKNTNLDFFIMFSSLASVLGSPGQSNYAAANAFMDALAHRRRAAGLAGVSINWAQWSGAGMRALDGERTLERLRKQGIELLPPDRGLEVIDRVLAGAPPQLAVFPVHWRLFMAQFSGVGVPPLFADWEHLANRSVEVAPGDLRRQLENLAPEERETRCEEYVQSLARRILGLRGGDELSVDRPLRDFGMDSLMAVEFRNALTRAAEVKLPATLLFDYPTLRVVNAHVLERLGMQQSDTAPDSDTRAERDLSLAVDGLSADEVDSELMAELEEWESNS